jgi:glutathione-regulated potassium-efflux system ancillary protein KefC
MEPHKGLLMSLFFVAVGMSLDVGVLVQHPFEFGLHVLAIIVIKVLVLYLLCLSFGTGRSIALKVSFLLAQGGEFGFVLFGAAKALGSSTISSSSWLRRSSHSPCCSPRCW